MSNIRVKCLCNLNNTICPMHTSNKKYIKHQCPECHKYMFQHYMHLGICIPCNRIKYPFWRPKILDVHPCKNCGDMTKQYRLYNKCCFECYATSLPKKCIDCGTKTNDNRCYSCERIAFPFCR